jgi:hypothetical protein
MAREAERKGGIFMVAKAGFDFRWSQMKVMARDWGVRPPGPGFWRARSPSGSNLSKNNEIDDCF